MMSIQTIYSLSRREAQWWSSREKLGNSQIQSKENLSSFPEAQNYAVPINHIVVAGVIETMAHKQHRLGKKIGGQIKGARAAKSSHARL